MEEDNIENSAKSLYTKLDSDRRPFLDRARTCAEYTLPHILRPEGSSSHTLSSVPGHSIGARGVKNLTAKLLLALFPPSSPFYKLAIDEFELKKIEQEEGSEDLKTKLEESLTSVVRAVMTEIEVSAFRVSASELIEHLVVAGNVLAYINPKESEHKVYPLDRYVCERDRMGNPLTIIVKESVKLNSLSISIRDQVSSQDTTEGITEVYTICTRANAKSGWESWQEVSNIVIPNTFGRFAVDACPFLPLRFYKMDGENYGIGHVEINLGDISTLEALNKALKEGGIAAARLVFLVNPNATTNVKKLATAENGDFVSGLPDDITVLRVEKNNDFQTVYNRVLTLEQRLARAFLLTEGIQRDAERVTAEEIRLLIQELDSTLGGMYALQSVEFQLPVATLYMKRMQHKGQLPKLPTNIVKPKVVTGIEAIGKGNDLNKLVAVLRVCQETLGPQALQTALKSTNVLSRLFIAGGVDIQGLFKTPEEIAKEQQNQQLSALAEKLGPNAITQAGNIHKQQLQQQATE